MDTRRLLSSAALYGFADMAVIAVGGFLLLPMYTRSLTQAEFGHFVAVRANIDIFTYLLQFGIPSALGRLYFDHRKVGTEREFISALVCFFGLLLLGTCGALALAGRALWSGLSPAVPITPYLPLSVAIAALGFLSALSVIWLRMQGRVVAVVSLQVGGAALIAIVATLMLRFFHWGLTGILLALLAGSMLSAGALPVMLGKSFRLALPRAWLAETLRYAVPILVGYVAYFLLNRASTLILQHHVPAEELAVFGLAQQLSMVAGIACSSFGMALQPAVYGAEADQVPSMIHRATRILALLMLAVCAALMIFAQEIFALVAPRGYAGGLTLLLILVVANFSNTFTLMSDTVLLYHRRPKTSVAVSILSAILAMLLGLVLIPEHHILGAAVATCAAFGSRMLVSQWMARRLTGQSDFALMATSLTALGAIGGGAHWLSAQGWPLAMLLAAKFAFSAALAGTLFVIHRRLSASHA
ncbi:lipopolysaccharide biosynthesis protein [Roseateles amylovorans]|uniref:Oligosaccharide flippase family protein n=1 Tax=Roseateles amylovorans TaxID=2978473 RepID=A0ABY6B0D1_9BURK|nr:oligosaccharide flippase family protein [Roseateles amylovorans]UXH77631.1 oligosaccharide flippase family protein [Roseateles amylovorans]